MRTAIPFALLTLATSCFAAPTTLGIPGEGWKVSFESPVSLAAAEKTPKDGYYVIGTNGRVDMSLLDGVDTPVKTYKLVFDPKSFTYLVPQDMPAL